MTVANDESVVSDPTSIVDVLSASASSDALAYVFLADGTAESEIKWTLADTAKNSRAFAAHLRDRGISAGDRVVLAVNPSLEYIAALYGTVMGWWLSRVGSLALPRDAYQTDRKPLPCRQAESGFPAITKSLAKPDHFSHD